MQRWCVTYINVRGMSVSHKLLDRKQRAPFLLEAKDLQFGTLLKCCLELVLNNYVIINVFDG
jgi:hypothetical protein